MLFDILSIVVGLVGLFFGGELLIRSASRLATAFGIPTLVIGVTVVALGTSTPELVVSMSAALGGSGDIALGSVVGSNIANIGLILGISGLILPLRIDSSLIRREIPVMVAAALMTFLMASDGTISRVEGVLLLVSYVIFTVVLYRIAYRENQAALASSLPTPTPSLTPEEGAEIIAEIAVIAGTPVPTPRQRGREVLTLVASLLLLIAAAQFTVNGAVNIARAFSISELVIGLTLVAIGTSLPEIATSVLATLRRHSDLAAGNAIGSNIANLCVILGITAIIQPISVNPALLNFEFPVMVFFAIAFIPMILDRVLGRWQAALLLAMYVTFIIATFR